ncbi:MAG: 3-deoxy-manno-octulosonate cytidylyltransferase [Burkholderiaceae bacterium]
MTARQPFTVLIPARMASTRLPNKPLADIGGLPMVVRVARQAAKSDATACVVAADDPRIVDACQAHGVRALLTSVDHLSGSDRLAQACDLLKLEESALVVNVQGDEPLIEPDLINAVAHELQVRQDCVMSTAAHPLADMSDYTNPNVVKVVLDKRRTALYFSRAAIPCWREGPPTLNVEEGVLPLAPLRHIGLYAYRVSFLKQFPHLAPAPIETAESLEQLRVLWHGERIAVHISLERPSPGVDTPDDLVRVRQLFAT